MLKGCVPWPAEVARRYIEAGLWEGVTVAEMVERTARRLPRKVALVHGEDRITYQDLILSAKCLASGLLRLGLKPQDRAVVQLPNRPEFVSLYLALNYIGVIPVMALRAHRQAEIRHFVRSSGAAAYFIADWVGTFDYRTMATEIAAEFPSLRHVVVVGKAGANQTAFAEFTSSLDIDEALLSRVRPDATDVSTMLLSGGTTSLSKLIPRTHNDYVLNARLCGHVGGFSRDPAARSQLQPGVAWFARRLLCRRHPRYREVHRYR